MCRDTPRGRPVRCWQSCKLQHGNSLLFEVQWSEARQSGRNPGLPRPAPACQGTWTGLKDPHRHTRGSRSRGGHVSTNVHHPGRRSSYYDGQNDNPFPARRAGVASFRHRDHFPPQLPRNIAVPCPTPPWCRAPHQDAEGNTYVGTTSHVPTGLAVSTSFGPTYYFDSAPPGLSLLWQGVIVLL